ncbi:hypothetical protein AN1V17_28970 [Vallitalea sediminicola]
MFQVNNYGNIAKKRLILNILSICFFALIVILTIIIPCFESICFGILSLISIFGMKQLNRNLDKNICLLENNKIKFSCVNIDFNQRNNGLIVYLIVIAFSVTFTSGIAEAYFKKSSSYMIYVLLIIIIVLMLLIIILLGFYGLRCYIFHNKILTIQGVLNFSDIKKYQLIYLNNGKVQFEANTGEQYIKLTINKKQLKIIENIIKDNCLEQ